MLDYSAWLKRASDFIANRQNAGSVGKIEHFIAPPLTELEIDGLARQSRLPIPIPLRRFWREAAAWCKCIYCNELAPEFAPLVETAYSTSCRGMPAISGGVEIMEPQRVIGDGLDWIAEHLRSEFPKDARFWEHSLPVFPLLSGDCIGLYVRDDVADPPVVYLCHEGCGGSGIIAPSFDEFLKHWEQLGYIFLDDVIEFCNPRTGLLDPDRFPIEMQANWSILDGIPRTDLQKPPPAMSEREWLAEAEPDLMLKWLDRTGHIVPAQSWSVATARKQRLFACACCRRVWQELGPASRRAVEVSERFADGLASADELDQAGEQLRETIMADSLRGAQSEGLYRSAAVSAVAADTFVSFWITQHLDDPELTTEKQAHCDLLRHIFGNPFHTITSVPSFSARIRKLADRLHFESSGREELTSTLRDAGHTSLAEHFELPDHPKGCWALDWIRHVE